MFEAASLVTYLMMNMKDSMDYTNKEDIDEASKMFQVAHFYRDDMLVLRSV